MIADAAEDLARSLSGPFAVCGVAVARAGAVHVALRTAPGIAAGPRTMFRAASISKIAVGQAMAAVLAEKGLGWETRYEAVAGWSPDAEITLGQLASHSSGLGDAAGYSVPPLVTLAEFCDDHCHMEAPPGARFDYCNLGYLLLADALQRLADRPFAEVVAPHLPEGAGFNWVGVPEAAIADRVPIYRRDGARFLPQIDEFLLPVARAPHPGPLSPQGGLRISMEGLIEMAQGLPKADATRLWTTSMGPTLGPEGVFQDYGPGLMIHDAPAFYPRPLIGHFANAYGLNGGIWYDAATETAFAYAFNGLPLGEESDAFSDAERALFDGIAQLT